MGVLAMIRFMTARRRQDRGAVQVVRLEVRERIDVDPVRTAELFSSFGVQGAQGLISDTLADLERNIGCLREAVDQSRTETIASLAAEIGVVAASLGFWSFARIAGDLKECARPGHTDHIPAIIERLARSLTEAKTIDWRNPTQPG